MEYPALRAISFLAQEWTRPHGQCAYLRPYDHRGGVRPACWPTTSAARAVVGTDRHQDRQRDKVKTQCPGASYAAYGIVCRALLDS